MAMPATRRTGESSPRPVKAKSAELLLELPVDEEPLPVVPVEEELPAVDEEPLPVLPVDKELLPVLPVDEELVATAPAGAVVGVVVVEAGTLVVVVDAGSVVVVEAGTLVVVVAGSVVVVVGVVVVVVVVDPKSASYAAAEFGRSKMLEPNPVEDQGSENKASSQQLGRLVWVEIMLTKAGSSLGPFMPHSGRDHGNPIN
jgi:hypothetical protein